VRIDQLLPSLAEHDAITNHARQVRRALRAAGHESDIYAEIIDPPLATEARHESECPRGPDPDRLLIYHGSTESSMVRWLERSARKGQQLAVNYHNVTPASYFTRWDPGAAKRSKHARRQLARLAGVTDLAIADSPFNQTELDWWGYRNSRVAPLLVDTARFVAAQPTVAGAGEGRWLFVGRVAPNKCHHDLIAAFAVYRRLFDPEARLTIVGWSVVDTYRAALADLANRLEVAGAVNWRVGIPFTELIAEYQRSDVFVCLSEHEGFCVPLLEAMGSGVPIVAYRAAAVGETVADAGVLLAGKDPMIVAAAVSELLGDGERRRRVVDAGRARVARFSLEVSVPLFVAALADRSG
jgi:glycosyltransferase involved in cell wall biosynthesis